MPTSLSNSGIETLSSVRSGFSSSQHMQNTFHTLLSSGLKTREGAFIARCTPQTGGGNGRLEPILVISTTLGGVYGFLIIVQSSLEDGDTVVPMIFLSDGTYLTNFSGDKKAWPVYMTIGNRSTTIKMAPSYHSILLIALLPIPIEMCDVPISQYNAQKEHNRKIKQHVLRHVLGPLMDADRHVFYAKCADDYFKHYVALPAAWIADYPEHRDLHNIKDGICYWYECPHDEMGEFPIKPYEHWDHTLYRMLSDTNSAAAKAPLTCHGVHQGSNVLWYLDCIVSDLPKPDLLHTMQLGMLKHLLGWLQDFLKQYKRLEAFNNI